MKLPNADRTIVDIRKLRGYALDLNHRVGGHKARLFARLLGLTQADAEELRLILLEVAQTYDATIGEKDQHGQRYRIDFVLNWYGREALTRSAWNVRPMENFPRLITCYPLEEVE